MSRDARVNKCALYLGAHASQNSRESGVGAVPLSSLSQGMAAIEAFSFLAFQEQVYNAFNEEDVKAFTKLNEDEHKVRFVSRLLAAKKLLLPTVSTGRPKNEDAALEKRNQGNEAFQKGDFNTAQQHYTASLLAAVHPETVCLALANRSAALYHMKQYHFVLDDIKELYTIGAYPKNLLYKVAERRARCYLALEQRVSARDSFRETVVALDDAKLDAERKSKLQRDAQIMLVMLERGQLKNAPLPPATDDGVVPKPPALTGGARRNFPSASAALNFEWAGPAEGRVARCNSTLRAGATVVVEAPTVMSLLPQQRATHCWHCLQRVRAPQPCPTCCDVVFCSAACRNAALASHHRFECCFLPTLCSSGASITCYLALRLAAQSSPQELKEAMKTAAGRDVREIGDERYDARDLSNFFNLVTHAERRSPRDMMQRVLMALFLLRGLTLGGYFGEKATFNAELDAEQVSIGTALLLALQVTQFNSHEVAELYSTDPDLEPKSLFIGGAVYPTLALLNHSCNPSIVRYFTAGGVVVARTVRSLQPGEEVSENYGPLWSREGCDARRQRLREQYWFECACEACDGEWPLYQDIPEDAIRLRCGACAATLKFGEEQIAATCLVCGHKTSVLASLAGVADTERKMQLAKLRALDKPDEAVDMYIQILEALDKFLAPPPCKDYVLCQQGLRKALLQSGNWHKRN